MKRFDIEVYGGRAYLVGNPDGKYVTHDDALEAITALFDVTAQRNQLLAALEQFVSDFEGCYADAEPAMINARAAIAAAKGGAPC